MTNREKLLNRMMAMSDEDLACYLEGSIGEDISLLICRKCQEEQAGACLMESLGLDRCPKGIAGWLREEAC